jgi:hypothetical protein
VAITGTDRGTGSHGSAATSFTLSPSGNFASGSWAVLVVAADNSGASGAAMATFSVSDTLGNTWTRRVSPLYDPGTADVGVEGAIFTTSMNGGTLATTTTITVSFGSDTPTAKAWTLMEIVPSASSTLSYVTGASGVGATTAAPTITTSSITNGNMVIGALFAETLDTITGDGDTTNGNWSSQQTGVHNTGTNNSSMTVASQRKTVSASAAQTYNPTIANSRDVVLAWIELTETSSPQTVTPSGKASSATLGSATVATVVTPSGRATTVSFGSPFAFSGILTPSGIASTATIGTTTLSVVVTVTPSGRASTATIGSPSAGVSNTIQPSGIAATISFGAPSVVGTLATGYSSGHRGTLAEYRRMAYLSNGWDKLKRWDGRTAALEEAGIPGPSQDLDSWEPVPTQAAGDSDEGVHVVRYRYMDSRTGYVSNPSEEREVTVTSGNGQLSFAVNTSGSANIIRSTDSKVDRIIVEMTVVGGSEFFQATEALNTASTIVVDISDAELETQFLPWDDDGHDIPPVSKHVVSHRDRLWLFGQVTHSTGTATFTNGSANVAEGSTDPDWRASALGDNTASPATYPTVAWFIQKDGEQTAYEIDTYDESANRIVLKANYPGTTATNSAYQIFTRANVVWVSRPGYPESFQPLLFLNGPNNEMAGDITAGVGYGSSMIFYSLSSMTKLSWDQDPLEDPVYIPLSTKYGALNQRVVIEVEGRVYAMDRLGWTRWAGTFPETISRPIDPLRAQIDYSKAENFHAVFLPSIRAIRWHVCYTGETYPEHYVQHDIDTGQWSTGEFLQGVSESRLVPSSSGPKVLYGDENGHTWFADVGTCDGCDEDYSHLTTGSGSTATVIQISGTTLPTSGAGLAGCYAQWRKTDGTYVSRLISSNTPSAITIASTFGSTLGSGETIWVGPIPAKLKTRAYAARNRRHKIRPPYINVEFTPETNSRLIQVRTYDDLGSTAKSWAATQNNKDGLTYPGTNTRYPSSDWLVDVSNADGNVPVPAGAEFRRYVEFELEMNEPDAEFELLSLQVETHERESREP